jgi:hypothetical protein
MYVCLIRHMFDTIRQSSHQIRHQTRQSNYRHTHELMSMIMVNIHSNTNTTSINEIA